MNDCAEKPDAGSFRDQLLLDLQPQLSFLSENGVRRFHLALGNVIRQFKKLLHSLPAQASSAEVRQQCKEWLEDFYKANFMKATEAIVNFTTEKVNGLAATNLVTYGWSPVVERILLVLSECPQQKEVSVLDSAPGGKGRFVTFPSTLYAALNLAKALALRGVQTVYGQLDAVGEVMRHAHIVLLGGSAVLSNGSVLAPRGAGLIALAAHTRNVPVLVTVKSYQFVDKASVCSVPDLIPAGAHAGEALGLGARLGAVGAGAGRPDHGPGHRDPHPAAHLRTRRAQGQAAAQHLSRPSSLPRRRLEFRC